MVTPGEEIISSPVGTIDALHALGVDRVHVSLSWSTMAPEPSSTRKPALNLADPASYPASGWAPYDTIVRQLKADGMGIDMAYYPPSRGGRQVRAPRTQTVRRCGSPTRPTSPSSCAPPRPATAATTRRPGVSSPLPRVAFWSIWNEPDLGTYLAPEAIDHS